MELKISKIQHVGIPVADLDRSEAFYRGLGFQNVMASTFEHDGGMGRVAMMQHGEVIIEIYQMPEPALSEIRQRKDGHVDHIAFDTDDVELAFSTLKAAGCEVLEEAPRFLAFWKNGCKFFNIKGPDGERLEFNQIL